MELLGFLLGAIADQALATLSFLIGMWADFLTAEEKRMDQVIVLEAGNS